MSLKRFFSKKSVIGQGLFLVFLISAAFSALQAGGLKECKNEADKKAGCIDKKYDKNRKFKSETKNSKKKDIEKGDDENYNMPHRMQGGIDPTRFLQSDTKK